MRVPNLTEQFERKSLGEYQPQTLKHFTPGAAPVSVIREGKRYWLSPWGNRRSAEVRLAIWIHDRWSQEKDKILRYRILIIQEIS